MARHHDVGRVAGGEQHLVRGPEEAEDGVAGFPPEGVDVSEGDPAEVGEGLEGFEGDVGVWRR